MKYIFLGFFLLFTSISQAQILFSGSTGTTLQAELKSSYYPTFVYSYDRARDTLYARVDRIADSVECVYTGLKVGYLYSEGDASTVMQAKGINAEHTWPQSFYNSGKPMVSDLHQLYPAWDIANSTRNNHPFAEVDDNTTASWLYKGVVTTVKPSSDVIDLYAEYYNKSFEPRESHKGNVARTLFYFWTMYQSETAIKNDETDNAAWFNSMKSMLYEWHKQDPADQREIERSNYIATFQGKQNPFVHDSSLIFRAYFQGEQVSEVEPETEPEVATTKITYPGQIIISQYYEGASNDKWIEVANVGQFDYDFSVNPLYLHLFANPSKALTGLNPSNSYTLTGILKADSVKLFRNTSALNPTHSVGLAISVCSFNGDDPVFLSTGTGTSAWANRTDVFGDSIRTNFALDKNFTRKPNIVKASATWIAADWEASPYGNINNSITDAESNFLGKHYSNPAILISGTQGWRMLSFPDNTTNLSSILEPLWTQGATGSNAPSSGSNLYTYDESINQFKAVTTLENPSGLGTGYILYVFADDEYGQTGSFPKVISYEDAGEEPINYDFTISYLNNGWNLVGNPYPFAIDWNSSEWTKTNINNTIYIYDNELKVYKSWNGVTGTNGLENGIIPAYQSFFVQANSASPILSVTPEAHSTSSALYKKQAPQEIRLSYQKSEVVLVFIEDAEIGIDKYDASEAPAISDVKPILLQRDDVNFTINALPTHLEESLTYKLANVSDPNLLTVQNTSSFSYDLTQEADFWNITINPLTTSISQVEKVEIPEGFIVHPAFPNPFNPTTNILIELNKASSIEISVFNSIGQSIKTYPSQPFKSGLNTFTFDASALSTGLYFIQFKTNYSVQTSKVVLIK